MIPVRYTAPLAYACLPLQEQLPFFLAVHTEMGISCRVDCNHLYDRTNCTVLGGRELAGSTSEESSDGAHERRAGSFGRRRFRAGGDRF